MHVGFNFHGNNITLVVAPMQRFNKLDMTMDKNNGFHIQKDLFKILRDRHETAEWLLP